MTERDNGLDSSIARTIGTALQGNFRVLNSDLDHYEAEFAQAHVSVRKRISQLLLERKGTSRPVVVCDIGCGTGRVLSTLKKEYPTDMLKLIGISAGDPRAAEKKKADAQLGIVFDQTASFNALSHMGPVDLFVSRSAFGHFNDPLAVLKDAYSILSADGEMYISWAFEHFAERFTSWSEAEKALVYMQKLGYDITLDHHDVMLVRKTRPKLELPGIETRVKNTTKDERREYYLAI